MTVNMLLLIVCLVYCVCCAAVDARPVAATVRGNDRTMLVLATSMLLGDGQMTLFSELPLWQPGNFREFG